MAGLIDYLKLCVLMAALLLCLRSGVNKYMGSYTSVSIKLNPNFSYCDKGIEKCHRLDCLDGNRTNVLAGCRTQVKKAYKTAETSCLKFKTKATSCQQAGRGGCGVEIQNLWSCVEVVVVAQIEKWGGFKN